jgi:hypothetical protein
MKKQLITLAVAAALVTAASSSFAAGVTATNSPLNYEVTLEGGCIASVVETARINLTTQASFAGSALNKAAGTVKVTCSNMAYNVCVNGGSYPGLAAANQRALKNVASTDYLAYQLKDNNGPLVGDNGCTALAAGPSLPAFVYAETAAWDNPITATGDGTEKTYNLTADVTIPLNSLPGTYQDDNVAVTVVW